MTPTKWPKEMRTHAAITLDPSLMMRLTGRTPDAIQARILRQRFQRLMLNCHRQWGKTSVIACKAANEALYYAPSLTIILGPSERQAVEMMRDVKLVLKIVAPEVNPVAENLTRVEFATGSRIIALPSSEKNVRGFKKVSLLIVDEASRVPDELYMSVRPMLAMSNGSIALMSTPFGKRGFFHKEWSEGEGWEKIKVTAPENPRITPKFLAEEKRTLPLAWFEQEYLCKFAETTDAVFSHADVMRSLSDEVLPLWSPSITVEDSDIQPLMLA